MSEDVSPAGSSPVTEFCAALRELRRDSGADPAALARKIGISRTQIYAILAGNIKRPPDWDRVVRPLVAACSGNDPRVIAAWRQRHAVLTDVVEELRRRDRQHSRATRAPASRGPAGSTAPATTATPSRATPSPPAAASAWPGSPQPTARATDEA